MGAGGTSQGGIGPLAGKGAGVTGNQMTGTDAQAFLDSLRGGNTGLQSGAPTGIQALLAQRAAQQQLGRQMQPQASPVGLMVSDPTRVGAMLNQRVSPDYAFAQHLDALQAPTYRETGVVSTPATTVAPAATPATLTPAARAALLAGGKGQGLR